MIPWRGFLRRLDLGSPHLAAAPIGVPVPRGEGSATGTGAGAVGDEWSPLTPMQKEGMP